MEDCDTEKYHASSLIQDFVFSSSKMGCIRCFYCRYIIKLSLYIEGSQDIISKKYLIK